MGLSSEMKNLSEEILASFKQRITENQELVNDVQKTLDGFRKDHQEMAAILNANAKALRSDLALGEKERLTAFNGLMAGIHSTIFSIQNEVVAIQTSTLDMIREFSVERATMAGELSQFFAEGRAGRMEDEKTRMMEFDAMMNEINADIKSINEEVAEILKNTNEMLDNFEKEHQEMSAELRAELSKNLGERVEYTRTLLHGFQKRLAEISKENHLMASNLRKDLNKGEVNRLGNYAGMMKGIHTSIKEIQKDVKGIQKSTAGMIGDLSKDRAMAADEWNKMQDAIAQIRTTGVVSKPKAAAIKVEKKEVKAEVKQEAKPVVVAEPVVAAIPEEPKTLEQRVYDYINQHPKGVKISEMEEPLGETRMKLGFTAKVLLDEGKVQKIENIYFPLK